MAPRINRRATPYERKRNQRGNGGGVISVSEMAAMKCG
jgi:hypothetical protein